MLFKKKAKDQEAQKMEEMSDKWEQRRKTIDVQASKQEMEKLSGWRVNESTIARIRTKAELANRLFFKRKMNINPGEVALWVSDGQIQKIVTEGQIVTSGVIDRLKRLFNADKDLFLMMLDTSERALQFNLGIDKASILSRDPDFFEKIYESYGARSTGPTRYNQLSAQVELQDVEKVIQAESQTEKLKEKGDQDKVFGSVEDRAPLLSQDRQNVLFDVRMIINFQPQDAAEVFKLLKGNVVLEESELRNLIQRELESRVFAPKVAEYTVEQIRQDPSVTAGLQKFAQDELFAWLRNYGIQLTRLTINPGITDEERFNIIDKEREALAVAAERQHERDMSQAKRDYETLLEKENLAAQLELSSALNDEEKEKIARQAILSEKEKDVSLAELQGRIEMVRAETEVAAQKLEMDLKHYGLEFEWHQEKERMLTEAGIRRDDASHASTLQIAQLQALAEEDRKMRAQESELHLRQMEMQHQQAIQENQHDLQMVSIAAEAGALDPEVMKEAFRQKSTRKAIDYGPTSTAFVTNAESQRFAKQNYQEGFNSYPSVGVAGKGQMFVQTSQQPIMGMQQLELDQASPQHGVTEVQCRNCKNWVPRGRLCNNCGAELD